MKNKFLQVLCLTLLFSYFNCEKNEIAIEDQSKFKTVNTKDALSFINTTKKNLQKKSNGENFLLEVYSNHLQQEDITNSNELLTTVPVVTANSNLMSRMTMIETDGEINAVIVSVLPSTDTNHSSFSGEVLVTDIEGNFISGYKIENGVYISEYFGESTENKYAKSTNNKNGGDSASETGGDVCTECPFNECSWCQLDAVEITNGNTYTGAITPHIPLSSMYPLNGGDNSNNEWDFGSGGVYNTGAAQVVVPEPDNPIEDMEELLECFDTTQPALLTIYADQPFNNSSFPVSGTSAGHAFVSLSQNGNTVVFGFYPQNTLQGVVLSPGAIGNNQNDLYDVAFSTPLTPSQLSAIINYASVIPPFYNLNFFNCTDYAIHIGNLAGLNIPSCWGIFLPGPGGSTPALLGQHLRNRARGPNQGLAQGRDSIAPGESRDCD